MKITARISFEKPANREFVIKAFFSQAEFSRGNSIKIEDDKTAVIELVFSNVPPQSIIKAISNCKIESLEYKEETSEKLQILSENNGTCKENVMPYDEEKTEKLQLLDDYDAGKQEDINQSDEEQEVNQNTSTDNTGETNKQKHKKRRGRAKPSEEDYLDIPDLDELSKESENFDDFVYKVSKWLDIDKNLEVYFCNLMRELKKMNQKPYEIRMVQIENITKSVTRKPYEKTKLSKHLTTFLANKKIDGGTFTPFIVTVLKFKDSFSNEEKNADEEEAENMTEAPVTEGAENADEVPKASNTPEDNNNLIGNSAFAEIFSKVNRSLPVKEQISFLYSEMGFNKSSKSLFEKLCELTMTAISMNELDSIDDVMVKSGIDASTSDGLKVKVKISDMINDYNKANHIKRMKTISFLREIKAIFS